MINVEITKGANENAMSVLKRFTRKVQSAGVLPRVRSIRYASRTTSPYVRKKKTLKVLAKRTHTAELMKLGKIAEKSGRRE